MMRRSTVEKAIQYLREAPGAYSTRWGSKFYLRPAGKEVSGEVAAAIMQHLAVECRNDGLFPWAPQTWRVRS